MFEFVEAHLKAAEGEAGRHGNRSNRGRPRSRRACCVLDEEDQEVDEGMVDASR